MPPPSEHNSPPHHPRIVSFLHSVRGLKVLYRQANARIHFVAAGAVVVLGLVFDVSPAEWIALVLSITIVIAAEAMNTALEHAVDLASPEWHPIARDAKDVAAAAVLVSAIGAVCVGAFIFGPKLF